MQKAGQPAPDPSEPRIALPDTGLSEKQRVLHTLNRLSYGPRPGDVERLLDLGLAEYIEQQLYPERIDDSQVDEMLGRFDTLDMPPSERLATYPPPIMLRALGRRMERLGVDPDEIRQYLPELAAFESREKGKQADAIRKKAKKGPNAMVVELSQAKLVQAVESVCQLQQVMVDFWFNHFNVYIGKSADRWWTTSYEYEAIRPNALGNFRELLGAVARHPAMLFYLDNWLSSAVDARFDHRRMALYASEAIAAQSLPPGGVPMLLLRDRGMDTTDMEREIARIDRRRASQAKRGELRLGAGDVTRQGLNENYARELLELHTLGVDGGYTQQDVIAVARCFTGWTLLPLDAGQQFVYVPELHDRGRKVVLGTKIQAKGIDEGEAVLDLLAAHPSTARFVSTKLARQFVRDDPPPSLIDRMAETFTSSGGEIREVLRTLFSSEEFWSPVAVRAKVKTPLEFVVSALRATQAELARPSRVATVDRSMVDHGANGLPQVMRELGQPLYGAQPPTGYADTAEAWISTGALLNRMRVALGLAGNKIPGVHIHVPDPPGRSMTISATLAAAGERMMGFALPESTLDALEQQLQLSPQELAEFGLPPYLIRSSYGKARLATGWLLATPEFQRR